MNRMGLGLAVGAGYVLGRTKKLKAAVAVGSLVAGKKLNLTPRALADLVSRQLAENPQYKEIGDQLRQDLRGVGKAASGAVVERRMDALADRLHGRTAQVRDKVAGVVPEASRKRSRDDEEEADEEYEEPEDEQEAEAAEAGDGEEADEGDEPQRNKAAARKAPAKTAKKAPTKKASAKKAPARKAPVHRTAAKKTASARKTAAKTASRGRGPKGGGER
ncbi:DNA primase [Streptomyces sp. NPDC013178]|uniref:DNA primase n=1 Tax=unclassified Streptomyces TaxID=2593676 RepID=UPI0033FEAA81